MNENEHDPESVVLPKTNFDSSKLESNQSRENIKKKLTGIYLLEEERKNRNQIKDLWLKRNPSIISEL